MSDELVLECNDLGKTYHDGKVNVEVFKNLNLNIAKGEQIAITGASGAGKSTLLHLLGGLDRPTSGEIKIQGVDLSSLSETGRCKLRNAKLGFVYQLHHLLPEFTVLENVCLPLLLGNQDQEAITAKALDYLDKVGLGGRVDHKISELSGGERQRTAIVRAIINNPVCVFADEPTGNLDHKTAMGVYETLLELNREVGTSFVIATHDLQLAARMDRVYKLEDGCLQAGE